MEIIEIIKDSFTFPINNLKTFAIYIVFIFVISFLIAGGAIVSIFAIDSAAYLIVSALLFVIAIIIGFILAGYEIDIIKSGIKLEENAPSIDFKNDILRGVKAIIVAIVYFLIPAIITIIVGILTNVPGNVLDVIGYLNQTVGNTNGTVVASTVTSAVPQSVLANLGGSVLLTGLVATILFILFSFIQFMANARLANTDSLGEALNIPDAFKDISRIGYGKVIATILLIIIITAVISGILSYLYQQIPLLSILNIVVSPFLMFVINRANGLLYSDIA